MEATLAARIGAPKHISLGEACATCGMNLVRWTELPVHVIDFEGSTRTGVVEFGVVTLRDGAIERVVTNLCRPRAHIHADETAVHGLNDAMLAARSLFEQEWPLFSGFRQTGVLGAHFSATENALLRATWACPRLSPDFLDPGREIAEWGPWLDTGRLFHELLPRTGSAALENAIAQLGLEDELRSVAAQWCSETRRRYHCAPFDALAAALILLRLGYDADGRAWSLAHLLAMSTADTRLREERRQGRLF